MFQYLKFVIITEKTIYLGHFVINLHLTYEYMSYYTIR